MKRITNLAGLAHATAIAGTLTMITIAGAVAQTAPNTAPTPAAKAPFASYPIAPVIATPPLRRFEPRDFPVLLSQDGGGGGDPAADLEEDCEWKNGGYAHCTVLDCDPDGVCIVYGEYCVDEYGKVMPCP